MLTKIISDGNYGAASGAISCAFGKGLQTGGYILKGYQTSRGNTPSLKIFNLFELSEDNKRSTDAIKENVLKSDGTICIIKNVKDLEETEDFIRELCFGQAIKILMVSIDNPPEISTTRKFMEDNKINTLHVGGRLDKRIDTTYHKFTFNYISNIINSLGVRSKGR